MPILRTVILGGTGFFGQRLVQRMAMRAEHEIVIAGRSLPAATALADRLRPSARAVLRPIALDLQSPHFADTLRSLRADALVHAAGPFQTQDYRVARACIAAGVHYIDLADGRDFVAGIGALDHSARAAGVAVISGASSVPALSSAAVDHLARGLHTVQSIDVGISPGNRTERGLSTVRAILGYCGQPLGPGGRHGVGWSGTWRHRYAAPVGERLLSPCDVPDLDLLPGRYPGTPAVRFGAGLELRLMHRGMNAMAWAARRSWVRDWSAHATVLKAAADLLRGVGSDAGAMHVAVDGTTADCARAVRGWELIATEGDGPYVPTLAASALLRRLAAGTLAAGATPCIGLLDLAAFAAEAEGLAITMQDGAA